MPFLITLILIPIFWLLIVRPQQLRQKAHLEVIASLQPGQQVMTTSGILGRLTEVGDELVKLEVAPGTELTLGRTFIRQQVDDEVLGGGSGVRRPAEDKTENDVQNLPDGGFPASGDEA